LFKANNSRRRQLIKGKNNCLEKIARVDLTGTLPVKISEKSWKVPLTTISCLVEIKRVWVQRGGRQTLER